MCLLFPFRLHAPLSRAVTHLMDDPIVPDDDAMAAAREARLPYLRRDRRTRWAGQPIMERSTASGELHSRLMLASSMRDAMAASRCRARIYPKPRTGSISTRT